MKCADVACSADATRSINLLWFKRPVFTVNTCEAHYLAATKSLGA